MLDYTGVNGFLSPAGHKAPLEKKLGKVVFMFFL